MKRKFTLKQIFIFLLIMMVILPILLAGSFTYYFIGDHLKKEAERETSSYVHLLGLEIDFFQTMAIQSLNNILSAYQEKKIRLGEVLIRLPHFESIYILDRGGSVEDLFPYDPEKIGTDFSKRPFFTRVLKENAPVWSDAFISPLTGNPTFPIAIASQKKMIVGFFDLSFLMSTFNLVNYPDLPIRAFLEVTNRTLSDADA
ncbi:MAG: hypothetical protein FJ106_06210 [Deltaproteobacteria bacterium]|nr:hypothetical protein [Deltaproteobacteria bacterium]